jgi:uncharacterized protein YndB with AHSA1/START domain
MSDRNVNHSTFTLERTYGASPARVFAAWADPAAKRRWFGGDAPGYQLEFRPGGLERNRGEHGGMRITWESLYREIVVDERIVYTSTLAMDDVLAAASLTTVEFVAEGDGTRVVLVEAGAYLDGHEQPEWREEGTGKWLDALGTFLEQPAHADA